MKLSHEENLVNYHMNLEDFGGGWQDIQWGGGRRGESYIVLFATPSKCFVSTQQGRRVILQHIVVWYLCGKGFTKKYGLKQFARDSLPTLRVFKPWQLSHLGSTGPA